LDYKNKNNIEKIAFVGISNWKLDASKMNRGIFLNVFSPESNKNDMIETANEITKIYNPSFIKDENNKKLIQILSNVIYEYKNKLNISGDPNKNFHGSRDFYNLIKSIVKRLNNKKNYNIIDEVFFSIECNYNGIIKQKECNSSKRIEEEFIKQYNPSLKNEIKFNKFHIEECIANNINENENRFLLLITQSSLSQYLIIEMLKRRNKEKEYIYYLGSLLENDKYNEIYSTKAITRIKFYLEQPKILILKNLSTTYASFYELFNQKYSHSLGKKYTDISIKDITTPAFVNDSLRIIILITSEALKLQDPPFINRFEKYVISYESILNENQKKNARQFMILKNLFITSEELKINPQNELINFNEEEINALIFNSQLEDKYEDYILSKLAKTFPQELIAFLNIYKKDKKELVNKINQYYEKNIHSNLEKYLKNIKNSKHIIYTFTSIIKIQIKITKEINNDIYGKINNKSIKHIIASNIKSERELEEILDDFYRNDQNIFIIHFENNDYLEHLEYISFTIERIEKEKEFQNKKIFIIIIHLKRATPFKETYISNLSSYEQNFIDNLNGKYDEITYLLNLKTKELYNSSLINIEKQFKKKIYPVFTTIEYSFEDKKIKTDEYINNNIHLLLNNKELKEEILQKIVNKIDEKEKIYETIFRTYNFENYDFASLISKELKEKFYEYLVKLIINYEKTGYFYSLSQKHSQLTKQIWRDYLNSFDIFGGNINMNIQGNKINVIFNYLPSQNFIKNIRKIVNVRKNEYQSQENNIRNFSQPSDLLYDEYDEDQDEEKKKLINDYFRENEINKENIKYDSIRNYIKKYFIIPKDDLVDNLINVLKETKYYGENIELLCDDYYRQYYIEILEETNYDCFELIKLLINLKFPLNDKNVDNNSNNNENDKINKKYIKNILWLEIYKEEMIYILNILKDILEIEPNIISLIKNKITNKEVDYIISQHHPLFKKEINYPFLMYLDSVCFIIMEIISNNFKKIENYLNLISNIITNAEIINLNLRLLSKDFYRLKHIYSVIDMSIKKNINNKEQFLKEYIQFVFSERKYIKEDNIDFAFKDFMNQFDLLSTNFINQEGFEKLIVSFIVSKYKEVNNDDYRSQLCNIIIKNKNLLKHSTEFFVQIFNKYDIQPSFLDEDNEDESNPFIGNLKDNPILKEINGDKDIPIELKIVLRTIFKFNIIKYFEENNDNDYDDDDDDDDDSSNEDNQRKQIKLLIGENSFKYFKNAYKTLKNKMYDNINEIYNINIKEQYCIAYCNVYLENFINLCFNLSIKEYTSVIRNTFFDYLMNQENKTKLKDTFKIVLLKLINTNYIKDQSEFVNKKYIWSEKYGFEDLVKNFQYQINDNDPVLGYPSNLEKYPYLFDIFSITIANKKGIKKVIDSVENAFVLYPVLSNYLNTNEESIEYLQNMNLMNDFVLYTIENYSYNIDRETAKNTKMFSEVRKKTFPKRFFKNFKIAFNENKIYLKDLSFNGKSLKDKIIFKKLDEEKETLSSFLIDNVEYSYGMQIAAVYQDFIKIQNNFLGNVKEKIRKKLEKENNKKLDYFIKKMEQKIPPQKAKNNNVISFEILSENYNSFMQLLLLYSSKDKDGNINYDLNGIENELENILLPEKKIFDENQLYVIYQYESFRSNNSSIIPEFCQNFPQKELIENEKMELYHFRKNQVSIDSDKKILFSILLLIFYLRDKINVEYIDKNKKVKEILKNFLPKYIHLPKETEALFNETNFTLSNLFSVYEYFELLCYEDFKKNTDKIYSTNINEDKLNQLNQFFHINGKLITKTILSSVIRKFISRDLSGKRNEQNYYIDFNPDFPNCELFQYLKNKKELWKKEIRENRYFNNLLDKLIEINIFVCNSIKLYDFLGGDEILLGEPVKNEIQNEEEKKEEKEKKKKVEKKNKKLNKKNIIF